MSGLVDFLWVFGVSGVGVWPMNVVWQVWGEVGFRWVGAQVGFWWVGEWCMWHTISNWMVWQVGFLWVHDVQQVGSRCTTGNELTCGFQMLVGDATKVSEGFNGGFKVGVCWWVFHMGWRWGSDTMGFSIWWVKYKWYLYTTITNNPKSLTT